MFASFYVILGCFLLVAVTVFLALIPEWLDKLAEWKLGKKKWTITEETRIHKIQNIWGNAITWERVGESVKGFKSGSRTPRPGDLLIVKMSNGENGLCWFRTFVRPWRQVRDYFTADVYYFKLVSELTEEESVLYEKALNPPKPKFMSLI